MGALRRCVVLGTALSISLVGCREPTQVVVDMTTDVPCGALTGSAVGIGTPAEIETKAPTASSTRCEPQGLGSLVVVPSGASDDELALKIVGAVGGSADACATPPYGPTCIVARRRLRFIPHTTLRLSVHLSAACRGITCGPDETCVLGVCKPSTLDPASCEAAGCDDSSLPGVSPAALGCGDVRGFQAGSPWPMGTRCPTHVPLTAVSGPRELRVKWTQPLGERASGGPSIAASGRVFAPTTDAVEAHDPASGVRVWRYGHAGIGGTPAIAADGDLLTRAEYWIKRVGAADGAQLQALAPKSSGTASPVALGPDGTLYTGSSTGTLSAMTSKGDEKWALEAGGPISETPAVGADGAIYVGTDDGRILCVNPDGTKRWSQSGKAPLALDPEGFVIASAPGGVVRFDRDGAPAGQFALGGPAMAIAPDPPRGRLLVVVGGELRALDASTGAPAWSVRIAARAAGIAIDASGTAYVPTDDGLAAIAADGAVLWKYAGEPAEAPALGADGTLYIASGKSLLAIAP